MEQRAVLLTLLLAVSCLALQVQPETVTVEGGVGTEFEQVFTLTNDQARPLTITVRPDPFSEYLSDAVSLSKSIVTLPPFESENLQVRGTVPLLGPETHRLSMQLYEDEAILGDFAILIPIEGNAQLRPKVDVFLGDVVRDEAVTATAKLYNFGNVIAYYNLSMSVVSATGEPQGTVVYPIPVQVLPGEEQDIALLYTQHLDPDEYTLEVTGLVNGVEEVRGSRPFRVLLEDQERTIGLGEDLVLEFERTTDDASVEYIVTKNGNEILRDTKQLSADQVTIPTSTFSEGEYLVRVLVTHGRGTDETRLVLIVEEKQVFSMWIILLVLLIGLIGVAMSRPVRLRVRIRVLEWQVARAEKQLNALIRRTHRLAA